jgi:hypothetical protein
LAGLALTSLTGISGAADMPVKAQPLPRRDLQLDRFLCRRQRRLELGPR